MRQVILAVFVVLTAVLFVSAQGKTIESINNQIKSLKAEKSISTQSGKESATSKVMAFGADFGKEQTKANNISSLTFGMAYSFPGNVMTTAPDSFTTTFWVEGKNQSFAESNRMTIIVDGEMLDVGNARYARKNGDPRQFLNYSIPRQFIEKIVQGRDVQLKIGNARFKFRSEHLTLFKNLLAVSDPIQ